MAGLAVTREVMVEEGATTEVMAEVAAAREVIEDARAMTEVPTSTDVMEEAAEATEVMAVVGATRELMAEVAARTQRRGHDAGSGTDIEHRWWHAWWQDNEHRGSSAAQPGADGPIARGVGGGHAGDGPPHLMAMRSTPLHPYGVDLVAQGLAASTALPTMSFYDDVTRDRRAGDEGYTLACGPTDVPAGTRSIGRVDGGCHDSMRAYEERHGRPMRAKISDVHDTRTTTARLSRTRKKGTGTSTPYHRRRPPPTFHDRDPTRQIPATVRAVADGGTGVGGSTTILWRSKRAHDALHDSAAGAALRRDGVDSTG
ncbi:hypothetical protein CBR_g4536 [Chara braunii]|uniref:Uncharacterized protein n=1 Tax=Chara braunii TaxID=69332 RepID=A0A388KI26_CHABU|nr:hypothetical protein CBR_g4536 [Chara braunii]|eukprot:GBG69705.1 hypothetical protein CBR_g4536 [Chara braunii]